MSSLTYSATLSVEPTTPDIQHDPEGPILQVHQLDDGSAIITFDEVFLAEADWQPGDTLVWDLNEDSASISCPEAALRKLTRENQEEYQRLLDDGAPV